jgi:hypothetical protein
MNKVQGQGLERQWKYNAFISSLNCVVGLSPNDGFYSVGPDMATNNNKSAPVAGGAIPAAKPLLGRAQRVLQRETNGDSTLAKKDDSLNKSSTNNNKAAAVVDLCNSSQDECSYMEKENDLKQHAAAPPPRTKKSNNAAAIATTNNSKKQSQQVAVSKRPSSVLRVLERVSEQERKGNPKRATKLLIELLEQNEEMTKAEKLQVHSHMATIAQRVGLLDHREVEVST